MPQRIRAPRPTDTPTARSTSVDRFLSSSRCANPDARRAYAGVLERVTEQIGAARKRSAYGHNRWIRIGFCPGRGDRRRVGQLRPRAARRRGAHCAGSAGVVRERVE
jgi:hypothetical protein